MAHSPIVVPRVRACAWFEEDPAEAGLAPGADEFLEWTWGQPDVAFVEPMLKRRLSRLARGVFHCAQRLSPPGDVRMVFASRHGEAERTLGILRELAAEREVSPALFSMSVHNAVPGLWSILKGNRAPSSALAAGPETFGWGLVEAAAAALTEPGPVLYLYGDDRLPELWAQGVPQPGLHVLALLLGGEAGRTLACHREPAGAGADSAGPQAHHFLSAWRDGEADWTGAGARWRWQFP